MRAITTDTETAGLNPEAGVVDVAIIEIDPNLDIIVTYESLIDPEGPISHSASGVHGIVDEDVADAPTLQQFFDMEGVRDYCDEDLYVIGHNVAFDIRFLKNHLRGSIVPVCTLRLARMIYPDAENHKLQTLRYMLGLEAGPAHRAHGDTILCLNLLRQMADETNYTLEQLADMSTQPIHVVKMPFGKHKDALLEDLPSSYVGWLLKQDLDDDLRASLTSL